MTALASKWPTLLDVAKREDPNGSIADIAELLTEKNDVLEDMPWYEGNLPTGHRHTVRTGQPAPTWRKMYGGVQPTKSTTAQVTDTCGMLEAYAEVDKALADLNGNTAAFRLSEDRPHIDAMSEEVAQTLFYGNEGTEPEAFTGLAPRFNATTNANGDNIILGGGGGSDNTSIWLVVWGPQSVWGIYPKGSKAGLSMQDKGQVTIESAPDGSGGRMEAYRTHYKWDCGLAVKDWRYIARIPNIDVSLMHVAANAKTLVEKMIKCAERVQDLKAGRPVFYANRHIITQLRIGILEKIANNLTWDTVAGRRVMMFDEIPVKRCDALVANESLVA